MGDKVKDLVKKIDPFTSKVIDPILGDMGLPNISGRSAAREQAAAQAARAEDQAKKAAEQAAEQARGEALNLQTQQERDRLLAESREQQEEAPGEVSVSVATPESATERRKKYAAQSLGGTAAPGPSVRI